MAGRAGSDRILFSRPPQSRSAPSAARRPTGVHPPDPDRRWTAEIEWTRDGDTARFCVVARADEDGIEAVFARSESFDWPPEGAAAVQALVAAAEALAEALALAGWSPLQRGEAWYAKRFEWQAAPTTDWAPPRPRQPSAPSQSMRPPTSRFTPAGDWPAGTQALWRCAITWRPGYTRSRFEAVMHDPTGEADDSVIAASPAFKWLLMSGPDATNATFRAAALDLATALESAGWERVGVGASWYAARFVWRGGEPPSDAVLVAPARARS